MSPVEWAEQTAEAQGFPAQVTDPAALARVAQIITTSRRHAPQTGDGGRR